LKLSERTKLSERALKTLPAPAKGNKVFYDIEGRGNVRGLGFRVTAAGARSWTLDYTDAAGKRRRATLARWPDLTLEQARTKASEFHTAIAKGGVGPLEAKRVAREAAQAELARREHDKTVAQLAEVWMETHAKVHKQPTSLRTDRSMLRCHILPRFGAMKIADVTTDEVEALHGHLSGTPIMANRVHALFSTLMRFAIRRKFRADNPCAGVKHYREKQRIVHTTRAQLDRLYAALQAERKYCRAVNAVKLLVWTGSRRGEVCGARWSEFDLARGLWHKPAERLKQKQASTIPLNPLALKLLREMHAAKGGDLLFPSVKDPNQPMRKELRNLWEKVIKIADLKHLRVHDLRHVFATTALEAGAPLITIAPLLGHSNTVMTARYAHLSDRMLLEATTKAGQLLAGPAEAL
jgi:integrase